MHSEQCDLSGIESTRFNDKRVTSLGRFLRKYSIDELPQLFDVIRGDLSLVGPRCHVPNMIAGGVQYEELVKHYHDRHFVKPGITGLAQVRGLRGPVTDAVLATKRVESDLEYIRDRSIWMDVTIILKTIIQECRHATGS